MDRYIIIGCLLGLVVTSGGLLLAWLDKCEEQDRLGVREQKKAFYIWLLIIVGVFMVSFSLVLDALLKGL